MCQIYVISVLKIQTTERSSKTSHQFVHLSIRIPLYMLLLSHVDFSVF